MAVTARPFGTYHAAAGDATSGRVKVRWLFWLGSTTEGDDLAIKNGDGTVILTLKSDGMAILPIEYPFGNRYVDGIETDVIDAGAVEYVFD